MKIGVAIGNRLPSTGGKRVIIQLEKETPGHIANMVVVSSYIYINWVFDLAREKNIPFEQLDADLMVLTPTGVCVLADNVGLDTLYNVLIYYSEILSPEFTPGKVLTNLVKKGNLGVKTGKRSYDWSKGAPPKIDPSKKAGLVDAEILIAHMLNEGCRLLEQGIVKGYRVIDKAVSIGYRMPGPFSLGKRNYKHLSDKLEEISKVSGITYLKSCSLMKSGEFLKMRK